MKTFLIVTGAAIVLCVSACVPVTVTAPATATPQAVKPAPPPAPAEPPLELDIPVPKGWKRTESAEATVITGPENAARVAIHIARDVDAKTAVANAWKAVLPSFTDAAKDVVSPPTPKEPFEKTVVFDYRVDTSQVIHQAVAHRYRGRVIVVLLVSPLAAAKKRAAHVRQIVWGIQPKGHTPPAVGKSDVVALTAEDVADIEAFIERARETLEVPGVAFALVQNGKVVSSMGTGHTALDKKAPITPRTHMMIGSITKSFTGLLLAKLVAAGKFTWDTPVTKIFPEFRLKSAKQTAAVQLQHLMCACTGVPRRDLPILFEWERQSPRDTLRNLRNYELLTGFGETFQYSNQLVAAAGFIAGLTAGGGRKPLGGYRKLLRREVLAPLGMTDTHVRFGPVKKKGRHGLPHSETIQGEVVTIDVRHERFVKPYAPAGALWSTAEDFAKLLVALTSDEGKGLPPRAQLAELWKPRVKVAAKASYGLGWITGEYKGTPVHGHDGGTLGFISSFAYLPQAKTGYVMLTNGSRGGALKSVLQSKVLARLFGQPDKSAAKLTFIRGLITKKLAQLKQGVGARVDPGRLKDLAGTYDGGELGVVRIKRKADGRALLDTGPFKMAFLPKLDGPRKEMYVIAEPPLTGITFWVEEKDNKPEIHFEPNSVRYVLKKK